MGGEAIPGFNMKSIGGQTVKTCMQECAKNPNCKAVEFADHRDAGGKPAYGAGLCLLQSSNKGMQPDAPRFQNLDLYIKNGECAEASEPKEKAKNAKADEDREASGKVEEKAKSTKSQETTAKKDAEEGQ